MGRRESGSPCPQQSHWSSGGSPIALSFTQHQGEDTHNTTWHICQRSPQPLHRFTVGGARCQVTLARLIPLLWGPAWLSGRRKLSSTKKTWHGLSNTTGRAMRVGVGYPSPPDKITGGAGGVWAEHLHGRATALVKGECCVISWRDPDTSILYIQITKINAAPSPSLGTMGTGKRSER